MRRILLEKFFISSPIGFLEFCIRQNRLCSVSKLNGKAVKQFLRKSGICSDSFQAVNERLSYIIDVDSQEVLKQKKLSSFARFSKNQMKGYFKGGLKQFDIPLLMKGTDFQKKVWRSLQKIQWGKTKTYKQLAEELKVPKGARAVGNCCARNPFLIVVPCHRVLSKKGLGGFALGLQTKRRLLSLEKIYTDLGIERFHLPTKNNSSRKT